MFSLESEDKDYFHFRKQLHLEKLLKFQEAASVLNAGTRNGLKQIANKELYFTIHSSNST